MNSLEKLVRDALEKILEGYGEEDVGALGEAGLISEIMEDFDSYLLVHVSDEDAVKLAENICGKTSDPDMARTVCMNGIGSCLTRMVHAWRASGRPLSDLPKM